MLTREELNYLVGIFADAGVNKIRLTGGEPLVRKDISEICSDLTRIPGIKTVGITTNAINLSRKIPALKEAGVKVLNISLDTLDDGKFTRITRRKGLARVLKAIDDALAAGFESVKVNCVVMGGDNSNEGELADFARLTKDRPLDVRFIEWMPFDQNQWTDERFMSYRWVAVCRLSRCNAVRDRILLVSLHDDVTDLFFSASVCLSKKSSRLISTFGIASTFSCRSGFGGASICAGAPS